MPAANAPTLADDINMAATQTRQTMGYMVALLSKILPETELSPVSVSAVNTIIVEYLINLCGASLG
jgi:hypothetical protein